MLENKRTVWSWASGKWKKVRMVDMKKGNMGCFFEYGHLTVFYCESDGYIKDDIGTITTTAHSVFSLKELSVIIGANDWKKIKNQE